MLKNQTKITYILINILAWVIVLIFPFFSPIHYSNHMDYGRIITHISLTSFVAMFYYYNYYYLINKLFLTKKYYKYFVSNIIIMIGLTTITYSIAEITLVFFKPEIIDKGLIITPHEKIKIGMYFNMFITFVLCLGTSIGVKLAFNWKNMEQKLEQLKNLQVESELQTIRYQLSPHFIVNTLNNIYSLIEISKDKAQQTIIELSRLLRYILYESDNRLVPLSKEMEFNKSYIELMRIRCRKDIKINVNILMYKDNIHQIAPLLYICLIENAFKHGISSTEDSFIDIYIKEDERKVVCEIKNSNFPKQDNDRSGSGVGLKQLEKRLELLYRGMYEYEHKLYNNIYVVKLIIYFKNKEE